MANIIGTSGDDLLEGTSLSDLISGLAGDDTLLGGDGNDHLDGGSGIENLYVYNWGDFSVVGNARDNTIVLKCD